MQYSYHVALSLVVNLDRPLPDEREAAVRMVMEAVNQRFAVTAGVDALDIDEYLLVDTTDLGDPAEVSDQEGEQES